MFDLPHVLTGAYDPEESLSVNVAVASPLLSRFDIIMVLLDSKSREWDVVVSDFILQRSLVQSQPSNEQLWGMEKLKVTRLPTPFVS